MVINSIRIGSGGFPIGDVVAAAGVVSDGGVGRRASRNIAEGSRLAYREEAIRVVCGQRIPRLYDARSTDSPAPGQIAYSPSSTIHSFHRIVEAEGEAVGRVKHGSTVILLRIQALGIGIIQSIVFGTGTGVRSIDVPT